MELTIALAISIISIVITCLSFFFARKDKSNNDTQQSSYKMGRLEEKIDEISKQIDKILLKLDKYDEEIDSKIQKAIEEHEKVYHRE